MGGNCMDWKTIGKKLLFPHIAVLIALLPIATALLVYAMVVLGTESIVSYIAYVIAAYTLTIWCVRMPAIIKFFVTFKKENKYAQIWFSNARLRVNVSLYGSLIWNTIYGIFQLWLGFYHHTFWFYSLGAYYICLAIMRFGLVRHTSKYKPGEKMYSELIKYRATGWVFLVMNMALALIIFFMVYWNRTFEHHMITAIAMATYTFTSLTMAIINVVKYRKYNSPIFSASKAISLAAACVSMLTLESTMLTTFNDGSMDLLTRRLFLAISGGAISVFVIAMAIYMIVQSSKQIKEIKMQTTKRRKREQING